MTSAFTISLAGIPPPADESLPSAADSAAWAIVVEHEQAATEESRRQRGAWYTPRDVVQEIAELALDGQWLPATVVDPTCGAGAFLLGVLDRLIELGVEPDDALGRLRGVDSDDSAVAACRAALRCRAEELGIVDPGRLDRQVVIGDGLDWLSDARLAGPVLVIGNPPFSSPLRGGKLPAPAADFRTSRRLLLGPYADLAAIHLASACEGRAVGDRVAMVLPQSLVSSRDLTGLRADLEERSRMAAVWAAERAVFDANVRVWAPVLEMVSPESGATVGPPVLMASHRRDGAPATTRSAADGSASWAMLAADALGGPVVRLDGASLGERVTATAGFRDEFYGLAEACVDGGDSPLRLVTVGSLDPLWSWWGRRPIKFAKQSWERPVIDRDQLPASVARWLDRQSSPKIVLPTQSKVFEPVIDRDGTLAPATPLLSIQIAEGAVCPDGAVLTLDRVAAMLLAPPLVAWARRRWFGAALSVSSIKIPAEGIAELPMPIDADRWGDAASLVAEVAQSGEHDRGVVHAAVLEIGRTMAAAYDLAPAIEEEVSQWWIDRLPAAGRIPIPHSLPVR